MFIYKAPNDSGSQFSKSDFSFNKEARIVLNYFFKEYNVYTKKL